MPDSPNPADATFLAQNEAWRARRLRSLTADNGWLTVAGRAWVDGPITIGPAPDADLVLPAGAPSATATADGGEVRFVPEAGEPIALQPGQPMTQWGRFLLEATALDGRLALRIRDRDAPERAAFAGLSYFPPDPAWRIVADWIELVPPREEVVDTMVGIPTTVTIRRKAVFTVGGRRYELVPTHGTPERPQFVFRDGTSGVETYGAARFLYGEDLTADTIVLDFNRAFNPPCVFTVHAVCPLPLPENVLPFRVTAGELTRAGAH
ncbi:MAG: DUF1684 domain-containing protein [Bauldia sp.]